MGKAPDHLTGRQFQEAEGTEDWRVVAGGAVAWFPVPSHSVAARLVRAVTGLPQLPDGALPDTDLRAGGIRVRLSRTGEGRFSEATVDLARAISAAARDLGLSARPDAVQTLQLAFDALDHRAVMPFWQTVLGYERLGDEVLADPTRRHPPIWFQQQAEPRPLRNRLHLDVVTSQPVATATLDAVRRTARSVAEHGYYATLADAEGNEVDVLPLPEGADSWGDPATEDWRLVFAAVAVYPVNGTAQAVDLAERVAELADAAGLPLGVDLRPGLVTVDTGKDRWEMDDGYRPLAARVQEAARELGRTRTPRARGSSRWGSTPWTSRPSGVSGGPSSATRRTLATASPTSSTRWASACRCSSRTSTPTTPPDGPSATGSTSTCSSRPTRRRRGWRRRSPPADASRMTRRRPTGSPSPTPRATRSTSRSPSAARSTGRRSSPD
jgi:hypothetical protein